MRLTAADPAGMPGSVPNEKERKNTVMHTLQGRRDFLKNVMKY
jgi:hypothetical protein